MQGYSRDDVDTHYGPSRPAVDIKVYDGLEKGWRDFEKYEPDHDPRFTLEWVEEHVSDDQLDQRFWLTCEWEFQQIVQDAQDILGVSAGDVEQAGRSGGWAVVTGLADVDEWDAVQLAKWRKFERFAKLIASDVPYQLVSGVYYNEFECWRDERDTRARKRVEALCAG